MQSHHRAPANFRIAMFTTLLTALAAMPPLAQAAAWIRFNNAGYRPAATKVAVVLSDTDLQGQAWTLHTQLPDGSAGSVVQQGALAASVAGKDEHTPMPFTHTIDFSTAQNTGNYILATLGAEPVSVKIANDPYSLFATQALRHLRVMRSGTTETLVHQPSHFKDSAVVTWVPDGALSNGAWKAAAPARKIDMQGGWYDAGDYIKFTLNEAYVTWHLLQAYRINPKAFAKVYSQSSLPDIIDEAKFGLDYLLKTMPDSQTFVIQVGTKEDHQQGWRLPENDPLDGSRRALCALSRVHMGSTAAALALGAAVLRDAQIAGWEVYRDKAIAIYDRAQQPGTVTTAFERDATNDFYHDATDADNMALAAAELYALTGTAAYADQAKVLAPRQGGEISWTEWHFFANHAMGTFDATAETRARNEAAGYVSKAKTNVWGVPGNYTWGTLHRWIGMANAAARSGRRAGATARSDGEYLLQSMLDYTFGRNNWGVSMLASQDLSNTIRNIYNPTYQLTEQFPVGALSEGPGEKSLHLQMRQYFTVPTNDPMEPFNTEAGVFYDNGKDFMIQESTIGGQADFILMMALAADTSIVAVADSGKGAAPSDRPAIDSIQTVSAGQLTWHTYTDASEGGASTATNYSKTATQVQVTLNAVANATLGYQYAGLGAAMGAQLKPAMGHGIRLTMDLPQGASVRISMVQSNIKDYGYHSKVITGRGSDDYYIDWSTLAQDFGASVDFDPALVTGFDLVNETAGTIVTIKVTSVSMYRYAGQPLPLLLAQTMLRSRGPVAFLVKRNETKYTFAPKIANQQRQTMPLSILNAQGQLLVRLFPSADGNYHWDAAANAGQPMVLRQGSTAMHF